MADKKPNILVIFGDDIGYWNISAYHQGMMGYNTPNIDRLAVEGAKFTNYYAQQSCTAGRAAFITGQSPYRTGLTKVGFPGADQGLRKQYQQVRTRHRPAERPKCSARLGAVAWDQHAAFHTTSICSPTRAALLTGRNHHRVHSGTIAERAVDWDGYTGVISKETATIGEVVHHYGYKTSAFGKWHNSPADQTTAMGPFDRWPTGHGFDYFYGFVAGETSQWEPRLYENTNPVEPPHDEKYHLSEDLADKAISWLRKHEAFAPDHPFLMYWASGAAHGPHHIFKERADKYKGKFDDGWDQYRERVFARQKEAGWIPKDAELTPRADTMQGWDDVPKAQRPFQQRLMEVFAGFLEHVDAQVDRILDELDRLGKSENTIVLYIFGDNGSSAEGQKGSISELLAQNNIPNTVEQQMEALEKLGGLSALGTSKTDNMYHAGWAWAGNTPFQHTKLVASHFGGTRNPLAISWPRRIKPDGKMRGQFHHVNDIVPTLYETLGIPHPKVVDGFEQKPMDGVSLAYTFDKADEPTRKKVQYFENAASRGIYSEGWYACAFGPFVPWDTPSTAKRLANWDANTEPWELYNINKDFSQANDLAKAHADKLEELKDLFKGGLAGQSGMAHWRGVVAANPPGRPHRLAVHEVAFRCVDPANAGVHGAWAWAARQPRRDQTDRAGERFGSSLCARRFLRWADAVYGPGPAGL